ncbi:hypothetical protein CsatA_005009 [Cannabis sativa]
MEELLQNFLNWNLNGNQGTSSSHNNNNHNNHQHSEPSSHEIFSTSSHNTPLTSTNQSGEFPRSNLNTQVPTFVPRSDLYSPSSPNYQRGRNSHHDNDTYILGSSGLNSVLPLRCISLAQAKGLISLLAKDWRGSQFLLEILEKNSTHENVEKIFNEIRYHVIELTMDQYGKDVIQKFLDVCNEEQRTHILAHITANLWNFVEIACSTTGSFVVKKLVQTLKTRTQVSSLMVALTVNFVTLVKNERGYHVILECLNRFTVLDNKHIYFETIKYNVDLATNKYGCHVLQQCIRISDGMLKKTLIVDLLEKSLMLAQDLYGNYVIQCILEQEIPHVNSVLAAQFEGRYVHLSMQKCSSHVVEKCLEFFNYIDRSKLILELVLSCHFQQLIQHELGNYVIQVALRVSRGRIRDVLVKAIKPHEANLRNNPFSRAIFSSKYYKHRSTF